MVVDPASPSPFGAYHGEILRAEGINSFQTAAPSNVTAAYLANFPMVILPRRPRSPERKSRCTPTTSATAARSSHSDPIHSLRAFFGLSTASGTTSARVPAGQPRNPISTGITNQTLQFHGVADRYTLSGPVVASLATLYTNATTATAFPAVATNTFGSGRAAAFTFDLAQSIAYTRQGNPATAGTAYSDGIIRTISASPVAGSTSTACASHKRTSSSACWQTSSVVPPADDTDAAPLVLPGRRQYLGAAAYGRRSRPARQCLSELRKHRRTGRRTDSPSTFRASVR